MKRRIKVRIGEQMSEGRKIEKGVRQGSPLSPTLGHRQSYTQCGLKMTSHNATRNAHDVIC